MEWVVSAIAVVIAFVSLTISFKLMKDHKGLVEQYHKDQESLEKALDIVRKGSLGVGKRVLSVESKLGKIAEMPAPSAGNEPSYLPYNHAMNLLEKGVNPDELVAECHLTEAEADLLNLIHIHQKSG